MGRAQRNPSMGIWDYLWVSAIAALATSRYITTSSTDANSTTAARLTKTDINVAAMPITAVAITGV